MNEFRCYNPKTQFIECDHDIDNPVCAGSLEAMIWERRKREKVSELIGIDLNAEGMRRRYYEDPVVYNLVNVLELLVEKHEETCAELMWFCRYVMGDLEDVSSEKAGYRAFNVSKKLR